MYNIPNYKAMKENEKAFASLPADIFTDDGLIKLSEMIPSKNGAVNTFWLRSHSNISVVPNKYADSIVEYLLADPKLRKSSSIRVIPHRNICSRAQMFGPSFRKAVSLVLSKGYPTKSEFYLPEKKDNVFNAALLLHLKKRQEEKDNPILVMEVWQYCPRHSEVFYIHAESPDFSTHILHLDGAIIHFDPEEVTKLFQFCNKIMNKDYEKQFRIDGEIPIEDMLKIVSTYLPVKELVDEAFEVRDRTTDH